jgi:hypothetical protein
VETQERAAERYPVQKLPLRPYLHRLSLGLSLINFLLILIPVKETYKACISQRPELPAIGL